MVFTQTKQTLSAIRSDHTERLQSKLPSQGFLLSFLLDHSLKKLNSLWSKTQSKLPTNIFHFNIKYLNNSLATRKNLYLWNLSSTSDCSSCFQPESLLHVAAGFKTYLDQVVLHGNITQHLTFLLIFFKLKDLPNFTLTSLVLSRLASLLVTASTQTCF